eukprot:gene113-166_t
MSASPYQFFFFPENREVTMRLLRYSIWMALLPIGTFYFSHYVLFKGDQSSLGHGGIFAVIAANVVIAAYVRMAWIEDQNDIAEQAGALKVD